MLTPLERVNNLLADLRYAQVDFDTLFSGRNNLTPLESVELFLAEQQRLRILKQNLLRRKRANLPAEKTLDSFDFKPPSWWWTRWASCPSRPPRLICSLVSSPL